MVPSGSDQFRSEDMGHRKVLRFQCKTHLPLITLVLGGVSTIVKVSTLVICFNLSCIAVNHLSFSGPSSGSLMGGSSSGLAVKASSSNSLNQSSLPANSACSAPPESRPSSSTLSEEWRPGSQIDIKQAEVPQLHYILHVEAVLARIGKP